MPMPAGENTPVPAPEGTGAQDATQGEAITGIDTPTASLIDPGNDVSRNRTSRIDQTRDALSTVAGQMFPQGRSFQTETAVAGPVIDVEAQTKRTALRERISETIHIPRIHLPHFPWQRKHEEPKPSQAVNQTAVVEAPPAPQIYGRREFLGQVLKAGAVVAGSTAVGAVVVNALSDGSKQNILGTAIPTANPSPDKTAAVVSATATPVATPTEVATGTINPTDSPVPTNTATPSPTGTPSATPSEFPSQAPTSKPIVSESPTPEPTKASEWPYKTADEAISAWNSGEIKKESIVHYTNQAGQPVLFNTPNGPEKPADNPYLIYPGVYLGGAEENGQIKIALGFEDLKGNQFSGLFRISSGIDDYAELQFSSTFDFPYLGKNPTTARDVFEKLEAYKGRSMVLLPEGHYLGPGVSPKTDKARKDQIPISNELYKTMWESANKTPIAKLKRPYPLGGSLRDADPQKLPLVLWLFVNP